MRTQAIDRNPIGVHYHPPELALLATLTNVHDKHSRRCGHGRFAFCREGVDKNGDFKKSLTFVHEGGVQEFVELMCKEKAPLHPEIGVSAL